MRLSRMKPRPVAKIPAIITLRGPYLSMNHPTKGEIIPDSVRWRDTAPEVRARLQPNCSTIGSKKAPKPCQKAPEVYAWLMAPAMTIHQP